MDYWGVGGPKGMLASLSNYWGGPGPPLPPLPLPTPVTGQGYSLTFVTHISIISVISSKGLS